MEVGQVVSSLPLNGGGTREGAASEEGATIACVLETHSEIGDGGSEVRYSRD